MRQERTIQASIFDLFAGHEIGRELKAMSAWLDDHRELLRLVATDLRRHGVKETGREGLPAEAPVPSCTPRPRSNPSSTPPNSPTTCAESSQPRPSMHNMLCHHPKQDQYLAFMDGH